MKFKIERSILKIIVKGSTYKGKTDKSKMIIFPYNWNKKKKAYEVILEDELQQKYPFAYEYFLNYKSELQNRNLAPKTKWYELGRSQGLNNSRHKKLVISNIFDCAKSNMKVYELNEDEIVYSGIFITCEDKKDLNSVKEILESEEFCQYSKIVGKNMSGGWKNISTKNIKLYRMNKESNLIKLPLSQVMSAAKNKSIDSAKVLYSKGKNDECYTPDYAVKAILKYIPAGAVVWCPFDTTESEFVKQISKTNRVIHSHLDDGKDFFEYEPEEGHYDLKSAFFKKAELFQKSYELW